MTPEEKENKLLEMEDSSFPDYDDFDIDLFDSRANRTTCLIDNEAEAGFLRGQHRWYPLRLVERQFIHSVEIFVEGYDHYQCEFVWGLVAHVENPISHVKAPIDGIFKIEINNFVDYISFRPAAIALGFGSGTIKRIRILGYLGETIEEISATLANIDAAVENITQEARDTISDAETKEAEEVELTERIDELKESVDVEAGKIKSSQKELEDANTLRVNISSEVNDLKNQMTTLQTRIDGQEENINRNRLERDGLTKLVSEKSTTLQKLENSIELFPSHIAGFVEQGTKDKKLYWRLAAIPIGIIAIITGLLVFNAATLTTVYTEKDNARVFSILLTRMPYVLISGAIIGACYALAKAFVSEIMRINSQTRALNKISIIAKDVSAASENGLGLDKMEIYHQRTGLKMDLLREHLKTYLPENYSYLDGSRVSSLLDVLKLKKDERDAAKAQEARNKELLSKVDDEEKEP